MLLIASCKKDPAKVCNFGLVLSDDINDYSVVIRNSCSGNSKTFYLQSGDWMSTYVVSDYCITNVTNW